MSMVGLILLGGTFFIYCYYVVTQYFAYRRFNYLQETTAAMVLGTVIGAIIHFCTSWQLNESTIRSIIFLVLLPPIMFEDGYNFPRRKFLHNIAYINLYGIVGSAINIVLFYLLLYSLNSLNLFTSVSDSHECFSLKNWEMLMTAVALTSIEPIVSEKVVNKEKYPKLFSIFFGECLFKDTIAVTLFDSILKTVVPMQQNNIDLAANDIVYLLLQFLYVVTCSLLIGCALGLTTTLLFRHCRFLLARKAVSYVALTLLTGYLSYLASEAVSCSGVVSMLISGTMLSHFNTYNLSEEGKFATKASIESLKLACSGVIFLLIGVLVFNVQAFTSQQDGTSKLAFSLTLLGCTLLALIIARLANTFLPTLLGYLVVGSDKWRINGIETIILCGAGLTKGAVSFALIVTIPQTTVSSMAVELNVVLVVFITTLLFASILPKLEKTMFKKIASMQKYYPYHPSFRDSVVYKYVLNNDLNTNLLGKIKHSTQQYWHKFEEGFLKPHLIYDYHQRKEQIKLQKLKERKEEYEKYYYDNILDSNNYEDNIFINLKLSDDSDSEYYSQRDYRIVYVTKQYVYNRRLTNNASNYHIRPTLVYMPPRTTYINSSPAPFNASL